MTPKLPILITQETLQLGISIKEMAVHVAEYKWPNLSKETIRALIKSDTIILRRYTMLRVPIAEVLIQGDGIYLYPLI